MTPFFTYHSGLQALIITDDKGKPVGGIKTADIRRMPYGWKCDDAALMLALPRATGMPGQPPTIRPPTQQEMAALARRGAVR
jgi:hypothetical protein